MNAIKKTSILSFIIFSLIGCSTTKEELLPAGDTSMYELWKQGASSNRTALEARTLLRRDLIGSEEKAKQIIINSYSRNEGNEIKQQFPRLPNPDMMMYIYPHLVGNELIPIPGYTTVFPFYKQIQYALPGERTEAL